MKRINRKNITQMIILSLLLICVFPLAVYADTEYETEPVDEESDFDLDYEVPSVSDDTGLARFTSGTDADTDDDLPEKYNPCDQGKLPAIRNQSPYGSCWSFASIGAMEADLINEGAPCDTTDLSELHLAYYAASNYTDPKYCRTDSVKSSENNWIDNGGHIVIASRLMTELVGAIPEEDARYSDYSKNGDYVNFKPDDSYVTSKDTAQLRNAYFIAPSDRKEIKKAIIEHGAVAASYKDTKKSADYNEEHNCYYYDGTGHNHAVMFVGWDDTFPAANFARTPAGDGAWLVRNSWGENSYSHKGYFWMSYYDKGWNSTEEVIAFDASTDLFDNCYAYDGYYIADSLYSFAPEETVSVIFPVSGGETARGVAFELATANVTVTVTVINKKTGLSVSKEMHTRTAGIYTAEFDEPLEFAEDADAEVRLGFRADSGENVKLVCESPGKETQFGSKSYGFMFSSVCDRGFDVGEEHLNADPRVRLYTDTTGAKPDRVYVEDVKFDPASGSVTEGEELTLTAVVLPEDATYRSVRWTSSSMHIATVSTTGVVKGISEGTADITATTVDGGKTATFTVTVNKKPEDPTTDDPEQEETEPEVPKKDDPEIAPSTAVSGVSLDITATTLKVGTTFKLTATVLPKEAANKNTEWSTSDESVATVSSDGEVHGVNPGEATITVTTADGRKSATCDVTVQPVAANTITLNRTSATVKSGRTLQLKANISPDDTTDKTVKWTTNKKSVATVTKKGLVKAVGSSGTATITATTASGKKATCKITVKPIKVKKVKLKKTKVTVKTGKSVTLKAVISPDDATNKKVTWKSKDKSIAKVNSKGVVTGVKKGKTTITVTTKDQKKTAKCTVIVR